MNKPSLLAALAVCLLPVVAQAAAPAAAKPAAKPGKMVTVYQAAKCHMYFSAAQAKKFNYACPDSKGKMKKVMVTPAVAKAGLAATNKALAPKKTM
jgi:predicted NUDIX family NTP pyrophosphohydrolase